MILTCCHLVVLKKFVCYIFQICRSAAMDQKPPVWMKKEETDEVPAEPGSMFPEDPVIIEEPSVGVKQDSELKHVDDSDFNVCSKLPDFRPDYKITCYTTGRPERRRGILL
ncbi:uncharacterized protein LOC126108990 isoform X6 [Schistocerca cancellata]|uniref:uncharacterized protein LOC126108990 isoform X6 n=1 Tax=Schistocerca cancellata TaxID=274614 RepID=UPI00211971C1|nr:uncharacterized protein LOC126108990 isoform X6 [Schistocerca cancellata]